MSKLKNQAASAVLKNGLTEEIEIEELKDMVLTRANAKRMRILRKQTRKDRTMFSIGGIWQVFYTGTNSRIYVMPGKIIVKNHGTRKILLSLPHHGWTRLSMQKNKGIIRDEWTTDGDSCIIYRSLADYNLLHMRKGEIMTRLVIPSFESGRLIIIYQKSDKLFEPRECSIPIKENRDHAFVMEDIKDITPTVMTLATLTSNCIKKTMDYSQL